MRYGSLFSGIGGFDLGFDRAGMECAWQVEYDKQARSVLETHWPSVRRYNDVREVGTANLEPVGLICGGFPCQDVSVAGKRAGLAGERSGLWHEFHRILSELTPEWVVIENVPGLLSSNAGRDFAVILRGLVELRYGVCWRVLDAQFFGVAQRRRRVFLIGHLGDGRAAEILFEREGMSGHPSSRRAQGKATSALVDGSVVSAPLTGKPYADHEAQETKLVVEAIDTRTHRSNGDLSGTLNAKPNGGYSLNYQNPIAVKIDNTTSNGWGVLEDGTAHTLGGATDAVLDRIDRWVETEDRIRAVQPGSEASTVQEHVYFKPNGITHSLEANRVTKIVGTGVRRLTPVECERLQGFPDGHTAQQADSVRYRQLGNAVAVPVAEWIGKRIAALDARRGIGG